MYFKILHLCKFPSHHNISFQFNGSTINYFSMYLPACKFRPSVKNSKTRTIEILLEAFYQVDVRTFWEMKMPIFLPSHFCMIISGVLMVYFALNVV